MYDTLTVCDPCEDGWTTSPFWVGQFKVNNPDDGITAKALVDPAFRIEALS